ncbi:MAG: peptidase domain-containing ABC transporter, partial [Sphingobacteriaceae bacterium]|nr:peptidase domain-containing ABC transporter [Sphingobacteriaceae bacterium]
MKSFPFYKQPDTMDCGPSCLRMIAKHYGKNFSLQRLREISGINREGVSLLGISEAAEKLGFRSTGIKLNSQQLQEIDLPCVLHWHQNHFVVLYKISKGKFYIANPAQGLLCYNETEFIKHWVAEPNENRGIALVLSPTPVFYQQENDKISTLNFAYLWAYMLPYKKLIFQLFLGLGIGSLLQLIIPFITQSVVDVGINTRNLNFIYLILIAQTMLFLGRISVDFIRSWILLHISTRINISILTDFLIKL